MLSQELISWNTHLWSESQIRLPGFPDPESWLSSIPHLGACWAQYHHPGPGFCWRRKEKPLFLPCSCFQDSCLANRHAFSEFPSPHLLSPSYPIPFCSLTAHSPRTVEICTATVLFLMSSRITAEELAWTHRCSPSRYFCISEDAGRKPMPAPGVEGSRGKGRPSVSVSLGLPSSARCSM